MHSLPTLQVQTILEHLITRKPAGVCADSFNRLLIACTSTVLKHLKVTNTAFPLSSTFPLSSFQGTELASSKFALAALNKPNTKHEIRQELRHLSPPNPTVSIAVTRRTCWTVLSYARKSEKAVLQSRLTARPLINSLSHQPTNPPSCFGVTEAQFLPKELHTSHQLALLKFSRKARLDLASYS